MSFCASYFVLFAGGVLIVAATSLIYLNQSVPSYAASLTSLAESGTSFPMSRLTCLLT